VIESANPTLELRDTDGPDFIFDLNGGVLGLRFIGSGTMLVFSQSSNKITVQNAVGFRTDTAELVTAIIDTNLNDFLKVAQAASGIKECGKGNAGSGSHPKLSASGDGTNVNIDLQPKGAADVRMFCSIGQGFVAQAIGSTDAPLMGLANSSGQKNG